MLGHRGTHQPPAHRRLCAAYRRAATGRWLTVQLMALRMAILIGARHLVVVSKSHIFAQGVKQRFVMAFGRRA